MIQLTCEIHTQIMHHKIEWIHGINDLVDRNYDNKGGKYEL